MHRFIVSCLLALWAVSAAYAGPKDAPKPEHPIIKLKPGHGMILLQVLQPLNLDVRFPKWNLLIMKNVASGKNFRIVDRYMLNIHSGHYVESLPPGEYEVDALQGLAGGPIPTADSPKMPPEGWRFKVEAGRLTNLGTLVMVGTWLDNSIAGARWFHEPNPDLPQRSAFLFEPEKTASLLERPSVWTSSPGSQPLSALDADARHRSMTLAGRTTAADNSLLFGEHFGQIARRRADGTWSWEDTGLIESILFATESRDGAMYAAAEKSTLLHREAKGGWRRIEVPLADARPCDLHAEADGALTVVWEQKRTLTVMGYRPQTGAWTTLRSIKLPSTIFDHGLVRCSALRTAQMLVLIIQTPKFSAPKYGVATLDIGESRWSEHSEVDLHGPAATFPDGSLFSVDDPAIMRTLRVSMDLGASWQERSSMRWMGLPVFINLNEGFSNYWDGKESSLWRTTDGGRNWSRHARLPEPMANMFLLADGGLMLVGNSGKLYLSRDGKTFDVERTSGWMMR